MDSLTSLWAVDVRAVQEFHPQLCAYPSTSQCRLYNQNTNSLVAIVSSTISRKTCFVTAHVFDSVLFCKHFNRVTVAEAVGRHGMAYVTRITHEDQWV